MLSDLRIREGWASVLLLFLLVLCIAWSIQAARWTDGLYILQGVVFVGTLLGFVVAKSRTPGRLAHLLSALVGFTWVAWLNSRVLVSALDISGELGILALDWRLRVWVYDLVTKGESSVGSVFLLILGLLLWLMAYFSAWAVFRWHRAWLAVIVCSVAMLANLTSAPERLTLFFIAFLLLALLLIVRTSLASYEVEWRRDQVHYSSDVSFGFLRAGLVVSAVAICLAWLIPEAAAGERFQSTWQKVSEPWRRFQEAWSDVFQDLNYQNAPQVVYLARAMRFGGPVDPTDKPILDIEAAQGRYWRTWVYHEYVSSGWINTDPEASLLEGDDPRLSEQIEFSARTLVTQTITLREGLGRGAALTAAGEPLRISVPVQAVLSYFTPTLTLEGAPDGLPASQLAGASLLYAEGELVPGASYQVTSSVSVADFEALREAGTEYPEWVVPRYLELPDSLPSRVRALAEQITAGLATPYEKAIAIEAYLRSYPYNERIKGPEPRQDGVDYFLFEERQGYCSYYASAMVTLLRSAGVPARYVEGYSQGSRQAGVFHIVEKDGHAWPEVFFPEYGWIAFEPTASRMLNPYSLSATNDQSSEGQGGAQTGQDRYGMDEDTLHPLPTTARSSVRVPLWRRVSPWAWGLFGLLLLSLAAVGLLAIGRRRRMAGLSAIERVYDDLVQWVGRLWRIRPQAHQTPHEYAEAVSLAAPSERKLVGHIADLYVEERFGGKAVPRNEAETAWRHALPMLLRRWAQHKAARAARLWRRPAASQGLTGTEQDSRS